jgi:predicted transcriptional regulator
VRKLCYQQQRSGSSVSETKIGDLDHVTDKHTYRYFCARFHEPFSSEKEEVQMKKKQRMYICSSHQSIVRLIDWMTDEGICLTFAAQTESERKRQNNLMIGD